MSDSVSDLAAAAPAQPARGWKILDASILVGLLIVAIALRVTHYDAEFSLDEIWHLGTTPGHGNALGTFPTDVLLDGLPSKTTLVGAAPIWRVWFGMDGVLHPPLYILTLRIWRELVGQSDFIAQLYSTLWSMIAIGFLFATARLAMNRWVALLISAAWAISQTQMYFAQEVRSYQMLIGLATITLWLMTRIELFGSTRRRAIALAAMSFPLLLTHYFAAGAVLAIGIYGLVRLKGHRIAFVLTAIAFAGLYLGTWVPLAVRQVAYLYTGDEFLEDKKLSLGIELLRLLCAPWRTLCDVGFNEDRMTLLAGTLLVLPLFFIRRFKPLLPWIIWLGSVLLAVALLDMVRGTKHLIFVRYFASASPAVPLLAVGIAWAIERNVAYVAGIALLILVVFGVRAEERISVDSPYHSDARNYVRDHIAPDEGLLIYSGLMPKVYVDQVSLSCSHSPAFQHRPTVLMTRELSPELIDALPRRAWIMMGGIDRKLWEKIAGQFIILEEKPIEDQAYLLHVEIRKPGSSTQPTTHPAEGHGAP